MLDGAGRKWINRGAGTGSKAPEAATGKQTGGEQRGSGNAIKTNLISSRGGAGRGGRLVGRGGVGQRNRRPRIDSRPVGLIYRGCAWLRRGAATAGGAGRGASFTPHPVALRETGSTRRVTDLLGVIYFRNANFVLKTMSIWRETLVHSVFMGL